MVQALQDWAWQAEERERLDILQATQEAQQLGWELEPGPALNPPSHMDQPPVSLEEAVQQGHHQDDWPEDDDDWPDMLMQVDGAQEEEEEEEDTLPSPPPQAVVRRSQVLQASQQAAALRGLAVQGAWLANVVYI